MQIVFYYNLAALVMVQAFGGADMERSSSLAIAVAISTNTFAPTTEYAPG